MGLGVGICVAVGAVVAVGSGVGVRLGVGVAVGSTVSVGVGVGVKDGVGLGGFFRVAVAVGVGEVHSPGRRVLVGSMPEVGETEPPGSPVAVAGIGSVGACVGASVSVAGDGEASGVWPVAAVAVFCTTATASVGVVEPVSPTTCPKSRTMPAITATPARARMAISGPESRRFRPLDRPSQGIAAGFSMMPSVRAALNRGHDVQSPSRQVLAW
jgi:hypothetical protein